MLFRAFPFWCLLIPLAGCGARSDLNGSASEEPARASRCGNLIVEDGEACDDGNDIEQDTCLSSCVLARCGDGILEPVSEVCDDGNQDNGDSCRSDCTLPSCGNLGVDAGEECDEGGATDTCTAACRLHRCGDGTLGPSEQCDLGPGNGAFPALAVLQSGVVHAVRPIVRRRSVASFYDYESASSHTGFEVSSGSRLYFYAEAPSGELSVITHHGIDVGQGGPPQPLSFARQRFSELPAGSDISVADDRPEEFSLLSAEVALGDWKFNNNTDGGAISGLPFPGTWVVHVNSEFDAAIADWSFVADEGEVIALELDESADLIAYQSGPGCRGDCTLVRCGDGLLDAGEACDDGNEQDGDGCAADCHSLD